MSKNKEIGEIMEGEPMKLADMTIKWPYKVTHHENGSISVPDLFCSIRREWWRLDDYIVSSITAGIIRLVPRKS